MTSLKRSFLGVALYLVLILILGQTDYTGRPIINFASYFYLAVMIAVPATLLFPSISKVSVYVPLLISAGVYMVLLQSLDRSKSTDATELPIIVLELVLLEVGIWLVHNLAVQMSETESLMDALALGAFPHHAQDIEAENQRIKVELTRSRRYQRPLSLLVINIEPESDTPAAGAIKGIQTDLMSRFAFARTGQIINDLIRQTDLFLRDRQGRYIILCSETNFPNVEKFAQRISQAVKEKTGLHLFWGGASFPEEALTFDDLLQKARARLVISSATVNDAILKDVVSDVS